MTGYLADFVNHVFLSEYCFSHLCIFLEYRDPTSEVDPPKILLLCPAYPNEQSLKKIGKIHPVVFQKDFAILLKEPKNEEKQSRERRSKKDEKQFKIPKSWHKDISVINHFILTKNIMWPNGT